MRTNIKEIEQALKCSRFNEAAELAAKKLGLEWTVEFLKNDKYFEDDTDVRDIYKICLKRGNRYFYYNYGQSLIDSQHYQDPYINERLYTLSGNPLKGRYKITDNRYYKSCKLVKGKEPNLYSILCCLTKYNPGTFEDFCSEFGYDEDSRKAYNTYTAVKEEYMNMCSLFNDEELDLLKLIQ